VLNDVEFAACSSALHQPQPRVALGLALRGIANSAIDISDGLLADLGHILNASNVGACLDYSALPASEVILALSSQTLVRQCILTGGDEYELCFTAKAESHEKILAIGVQLGLQLTCIGETTVGQGCVVQDDAGINIDVKGVGYDHFR